MRGLIGGVSLRKKIKIYILTWRLAYQSSKYLADLISQGRLVPTPSVELDKIFSTQEQITTEQGKSEKTKEGSEVYEGLMILKPHHIKALAQEFKMERQLTVDLSRARLQTIKSIQEGQLSKLEAAAMTAQEEDQPPQRKTR